VLLVSSVSYLFLFWYRYSLPAGQACLPACQLAGSPLIISVCIKICDGSFHLLGLLLIIKAAITPGNQPRQVKIKTMIKEPQPLSTTAKCGKIMQRITLKMPISIGL